MAEFLTTTGVSHHLERIIKGAKRKLYLISPYLQLNNQLKQFLSDSDLSEIKIIYGKKEKLKELDLEWIMGDERVSLYYLDNLHAKCYLNESAAIVTSLNLYEYSQVSNVEMGVLADYFQDYSLYSGVLKEAGRIINNASCIKEATQNNKKNLSSGVEKEKKSKIHYGYCIRTGVEITFNPDRPLSIKAFNIWAQFEDYNYPEKYCHFTGELSNGETCYGKPILKKNWRASRNFTSLE